MRPGDGKSVFANHLLTKYGVTIAEEVDLRPEPEAGVLLLVMDGGMILHSVKYARVKGSSFRKITDAYVTYSNNLLTHSDHENLLIVFDGYGRSSTKDNAHVQRSPTTSLEIVFHEGTIFDSKKYVFLSNDINKQRFVNMISDKCGSNGHTTINCEADADLQIVSTGLNAAKEDRVMIIANDTDIFVHLCHYLKGTAAEYKDIWLKHFDKRYDMKRTVDAIPQNVLNSILLAHGFTGCDTVYTIFRIGKTSILKKNIITEEIAITFHSH